MQEVRNSPLGTRRRNHNDYGAAGMEDAKYPSEVRSVVKCICIDYPSSYCFS